MRVCKNHWFYVPYDLRVVWWGALESGDTHLHSDDATEHATIAIENWIERYTGQELTSKICNVRSEPQSAVPTRGESMSNSPNKTLAAALMAAANVLLAADGADGAAPTTTPEAPAAPAKGRGRPPKPAPTPPADDLGGDDLGGDDLGGDDLGDGLDDEPAAPAAPTEEDLRRKLIELKNLDGDNTRVQLVCKRFTGDKAPLAKNVPPEQYAAAIELAQKQIAKGKPKAK